MAAVDLYAFNSADWDYEYSSMLRCTNPGETYPSLCPFYLVDHPDGTVLIDTGVSHDLVENPESYGPHGTPGFADFAADDIHVDEHAPAAEQVRAAGYEPGDVDLVILTHLHLDHAGGISAFPDAEFLVQQDELTEAFWPADPAQRRLYVLGDIAPLRAPGVDVTALEGRHDVFGDGTVECVPTPGHTAGHQSVRVDLPESGTVVLAGDLAFTEDALESDYQPPFAWDTREAIRSAKEVQDLARRTDADVFLAHDRDHHERLPTPPASLA